MRKLQSDNPYIRQIGARQTNRLDNNYWNCNTCGYGRMHKAMTGITKEMYNAYKDRFAPPWEKASDLIPVTQQKEDDHGKQLTFHTMFHTQMWLHQLKLQYKLLEEGKNTDQITGYLFANVLLKIL